MKRHILYCIAAHQQRKIILKSLFDVKKASHCPQNETIITISLFRSAYKL